MSEPRFFLPFETIDVRNRTVLISQPGLVKQIFHVLRKKSGDKLIVLDGLGSLFHCTITKIARNHIQAEIVNQEPASGEPSIKVTVALPWLKGGRFEWALQKMSELGVSKVVPVITERSTIRTCTPDKLTRWSAILREAAEQCERAIIPQVVQAQLLSNLLHDPLHNPGLSLVCIERTDKNTLFDFLFAYCSTQQKPRGVFILLGPEGGFSPIEIKEILSAGFQPVSLGKRILKVETAAIYALAQIISFFDN